MSPRILTKGNGWMVWFWPYKVAHPQWGMAHGTDGKSHWLWLWCIQVWWHNARLDRQEEAR